MATPPTSSTVSGQTHNNRTTSKPHPQQPNFLMSRLKQATDRLRLETTHLRDRLRSEHDAVRQLRAQHAAELRSERTAARRKRLELEAQLHCLQFQENDSDFCSLVSRCEQCVKLKTEYEAEIRREKNEFKRKEEMLKRQLNNLTFSSNNTTTSVVENCLQCSKIKTEFETELKKERNEYKEKEILYKNQLKEKENIISSFIKSSSTTNCKQCVKVKSDFEVELRKEKNVFKKKEENLLNQLKQKENLLSSSSTNSSLINCEQCSKLKSNFEAELRKERTDFKKKEDDLLNQIKEKEQLISSSTSTTFSLKNCEQCSKVKSNFEAELRKERNDFKKKEENLINQLKEREKLLNSPPILSSLQNCEQCVKLKSNFEAELRKERSEHRKKEESLKNQLKEKNQQQIPPSNSVVNCAQCARIKSEFDASLRKEKIEFRKKETNLKNQLIEVKKLLGFNSQDGSGCLNCVKLLKDIGKYKETLKELEEKHQKVSESDRLKAADLRIQHEKHLSELSQITKASKHSVQKLLEEIKTKDRIIMQLRRNVGRQRVKGQECITSGDNAQMRKLKEEARKTEQSTLLSACDPKTIPENYEKFQQNEILLTNKTNKEQMVCGGTSEDLEPSLEEDTDSAVSSAPSSLSPQPCSPLNEDCHPLRLKISQIPKNPTNQETLPTSLSPQPSEGYTTPPPLWLINDDDLCSETNQDEQNGVSNELTMARRQVRELERALLVTRASKQSNRHVTLLEERVKQLEEREASLIRELTDLREQNELLEFRVLELAECADKVSITMIPNQDKMYIDKQDANTNTDFNIEEQLLTLENLNGEPVRKKLIQMVNHSKNKEDKKCLLQVLLLLNGLEELSRRKENLFVSMEIDKITPKLREDSNINTIIRSGIRQPDRLIAKVPPFTGRTSDSDDERDTESPKRLQEFTISRGTQTDSDLSDINEKAIKSLDLTAEVKKLDKLRETIEVVGNKNGKLVVSNISDCSCDHKTFFQRQLEFYRERVDTLERKVSIYESSGDHQLRQLAERLNKEIHLEAQIKHLTITIQKLQSDNFRLEEERCELEEAENDTRLRCQKLEVELTQLEKSRMSAKRRARDARSQSDYWEAMVNKYEERNYELEEKECELRHRLEILENKAPQILLLNTWKEMQNNPNLNITETNVEVERDRSPLFIKNPEDCSCHSKSSNQQLKDKVQLLEEERVRLLEQNRNIEHMIWDLENKLIEVKSNTNQTPDVFDCKVFNSDSLKTEDMELMSVIQELRERENQLKKRIEDLEKREAAYLETLQQADEIWAEMETGYKKRINEAEQTEAQLRDKVRRLEKKDQPYDELEDSERELALKAERLNKENSRLLTENKRLERELCSCRDELLSKRQDNLEADRLAAELTKEKRRVEELIQKLTEGETNYTEQGNIHRCEIESLKFKLSRTTNELVHLEVTNAELKEEVDTLESKIAEMECAMQQKTTKDETVIRNLTQELNEKDKELRVAKQQNAVSTAGERLGFALQEVKNCDLCGPSVSPDLIDTIEDVQALCHMVNTQTSLSSEKVSQVRKMLLPSSGSCMQSSRSIQSINSSYQDETIDNFSENFNEMSNESSTLVFQNFLNNKLQPTELNAQKIEECNCGDCACQICIKKKILEITSTSHEVINNLALAGSVGLLSLSNTVEPKQLSTPECYKITTKLRKLQPKLIENSADDKFIEALKTSESYPESKLLPFLNQIKFPSIDTSLKKTPTDVACPVLNTNPKENHPSNCECIFCASLQPNNIVHPEAVNFLAFSVNISPKNINKDEKQTESQESIPQNVVCRCEECICNTCRLIRAQQTAATSPVVAQTSQTLNMQGNQIELLKPPNKSNCECKDCDCKHCKKMLSLQQPKSNEIEIISAVHPTNCICTQCVCNACETKNTSNKPAAPTIIPQQTVNIRGNKIEIVYPHHAPDCTCEICKCNKCTPNELSIKKHSSKHDDDDEDVRPVNLPYSLCDSCKCQTCRIITETTDKDNISHTTDCTCPKCICLNCIKIQSCTHPENCTCNICKYAPKLHEQNELPSLSELTSINESVHNEILSPKKIEILSARLPNCDCNFCNCETCTNIKASTPQLTEILTSIKDNISQKIVSEKPQKTSSITSTVHDEKTIPTRHPNCDCEICRCGTCAQPNSSLQSDTSTIKEPIKLPIKEPENIIAIPEHSSNCDCDICKCSSCKIPDNKYNSILEQQHPPLEIINSKILSEKKPSDSTNSMDCDCDVCSCSNCVSSTEKPKQTSTNTTLSSNCDCSICLCQVCKQPKESSIPKLITPINSSIKSPILSSNSFSCKCNLIKNQSSKTSQRSTAIPVRTSVSNMTGSNIITTQSLTSEKVKVNKINSNIINVRGRQIEISLPRHSSSCNCETCVCNICKTKSKIPILTNISQHLKNCRCKQCVCLDETKTLPTSDVVSLGLPSTKSSETSRFTSPPPNIIIPVGSCCPLPPTIQEIEHYDLITEVNVTGRSPFSSIKTMMDIKPDVKPGNFNVRTSLTDSGNIKLYTDGPQGTVKHTMVYTPSGNMQLETEFSPCENEKLLTCVKSQGSKTPSVLSKPEEIKRSSCEAAPISSAFSSVVSSKQDGSDHCFCSSSVICQDVNECLTRSKFQTDSDSFNACCCEGEMKTSSLVLDISEIPRVQFDSQIMGLSYIMSEASADNSIAPSNAISRESSELSYLQHTNIEEFKPTQTSETTETIMETKEKSLDPNYVKSLEKYLRDQKTPFIPIKFYPVDVVTDSKEDSLKSDTTRTTKVGIAADLTSLASEQVSILPESDTSISPSVGNQEMKSQVYGVSKMNKSVKHSIANIDEMSIIPGESIMEMGKKSLTPDETMPLMVNIKPTNQFDDSISLDELGTDSSTGHSLLELLLKVRQSTEQINDILDNATLKETTLKAILNENQEIEDSVQKGTSFDINKNLNNDLISTQSWDYTLPKTDSAVSKELYTIRTSNGSKEDQLHNIAKESTPKNKTAPTTTTTIEENSSTTKDEKSFATRDEKSFTTKDEKPFTTKDEMFFTSNDKKDENVYLTEDEDALKNVEDEDIFQTDDDEDFKPCVCPTNMIEANERRNQKPECECEEVKKKLPKIKIKDLYKFPYIPQSIVTYPVYQQKYYVLEESGNEIRYGKNTKTTEIKSPRTRIDKSSLETITSSKNLNLTPVNAHSIPVITEEFENLRINHEILTPSPTSKIPIPIVKLKHSTLNNNINKKTSINIFNKKSIKETDTRLKNFNKSSINIRPKSTGAVLKTRQNYSEIYKRNKKLSEKHNKSLHDSEFEIVKSNKSESSIQYSNSTLYTEKEVTCDLEPNIIKNNKVENFSLNQNDSYDNFDYSFEQLVKFTDFEPIQNEYLDDDIISLSSFDNLWESNNFNSNQSSVFNNFNQSITTRTQTAPASLRRPVFDIQLKMESRSNQTFSRNPWMERNTIQTQIDEGPTCCQSVAVKDDWSYFDTIILEEKLKQVETDAQERYNEIVKLHKLINNFKAKCTKPESTQSNRLKESTIKGLNCALKFLKEKCENLDQIIVELIKELRKRNNEPESYQNFLENITTRKEEVERQVMRTPAEKPCAGSKDESSLNQESRSQEMIDPSPLSITEIKKIGNDSLLIKWQLPASKQIQGFEVEVDGELKARVRSPSRSAAVLDGLYLENKPLVNLYVYALSMTGVRCLPPASAVYQPF